MKKIATKSESAKAPRIYPVGASIEPLGKAPVTRAINERVVKVDPNFAARIDALDRAFPGKMSHWETLPPEHSIKIARRIARDKKYLASLKLMSKKLGSMPRSKSAAKAQKSR